MEELDLELIILVIIMVLVVIAGVGIFMGSRISGDRKRIKELEGELEDARKDMEVYRNDVNGHFKKTSDLFAHMTDSYKAVYLHMVEGAQDLCTSDAGLLKGANSDFLKVVHEKSGESTDDHAFGEDQVAREPKIVTEQPEPSGEQPDTIPEQVKVENIEGAEVDVVAEDHPVSVEEGAAVETDPAEDSREKKDGLSADRAASRQG